MNKKKGIISAILMISLVCTSCAEDSSSTNYDIKNVDTIQDSIVQLNDQNYSTKLSTNSDGSLLIERNIRENPQSMGNDGTWTIFIYMCGSDLESEDGSASLDLQEMCDATSSENYKFVIQTGGSNTWNNDNINANNIQRFIVENGDISLVYEDEISNMGSSETLSEFLIWGVGEYPAENMGVILWNHGGGSVSGVCFDETQNNDSLSLKELDNAFTMVYPYMTDKFEFIGFDACLMSTIETANILVPHANYMVASQETESGYGWDYTAIGDFLADNPTCDGSKLGKEICNSFYSSSKLSWESFDCTLSCVDLSKIDNLLINFNQFYQDIYNSSSDNSSNLGNISRDISYAESFGGNNKTEGFTNMIDFGSMIDELSSYSKYSKDVETALDDCIVYSKNGLGKLSASGLSIYYPLTFEYTDELEIFKDICVSPYYMSFIDMLNYGNSNNGDISNYSNNIWLDTDSIFWDNDNQYSDYNIDYWEYSNDCIVEFSQQPTLNDDDGIYSFTISNDTLDYVDSIYCNIMRILDDGTIDDLGTDNYVNIDWNTGKVSDMFEGWWYLLNDGQPLAMYLIEESEDYDIYTSPVYINYEETNLRIMYDYSNNTISILGAWNGINENGQADRDIYELQVGDIITPIYDYYYDNDSYIEYYDYYGGDDYIYTGSDDIILEYLPQGNYYYCFEVNDIFGGYTLTDYVLFNVDETGQVYY